jgi:hypothetical protein
LETQAQVARLHPDRRGDRCDVEFGGELLVRHSRDPERDLARALLTEGIAGIVTTFDGKTGKPRIISKRLRSLR